MYTIHSAIEMSSISSNNDDDMKENPRKSNVFMVMWLFYHIFSSLHLFMRLVSNTNCNEFIIVSYCHIWSLFLFILSLSLLVLLWRMWQERVFNFWRYFLSVSDRLFNFSCAYSHTILLHLFITKRFGPQKLLNSFKSGLMFVSNCLKG
jgi:hypothetical protein